jgi:hypothetical protein
MAVGLPLKTTYANGDVYSASDVNDTNGTVNLVGQTNNFYAGKNKIINGDFYINQRAFTSSTSGGYGLDRWSAVVADGTVTYSVQTFTVGAAPVTGYEGKNFARLVTTGQTLSTAQARLFQAIEDVRTFANQTVTISFWAKAATGTPKMAIELNQDFGTGGSPSAAVANYAGQVTLSTSWVRYSLTLAIPSISGKTIGTTTPGGLFLQMWGSAGSSFNARTGSLGIQSNTFDIWGVQVESGSTATAFQTASGTIQGELAACQRYYFRHTAAAPTVRLGIYAISGTTTQANGYIQFPVPMRVAPTSMDTNTLKYSNYAGAGFNITSLAYNEASEVIAQIYGTISVTTLATPGSITSQAVGSYLGFSAEL